MPGIGLNPSGCCCGGSLCVDLSSPCDVAHKNAVTITVKDHASGSVLATDVTDSAGHVCFSGLPAGTYDVAAAKTDCSSTSWTNASVGDTLVGVIDCYPISGRQFSVTGCASLPLPGAVITISGPGTAVLTTDANGQAVYSPPALGTYTAIITHPSGRFNSATRTWNQATSCTTGNTNVAMGVATGYTCCVPGTPFPIKNTLTITDAGGTSTFTLSAFTCGSPVCLIRTMSDVSVTGNAVALSCTPSGIALFPPPDIATRSTAVRYTVGIGNPPTMVQSEWIYVQAGTYRLQYHGNHDVDGFCSPLDTYRGWRYQTSCPPPATLSRDSYPTTVVVNSLYPFSATFTFAPGDGYGPSPTNINPGPYSTTVVISE